MTYELKTAELLDDSYDLEGVQLTIYDDRGRAQTHYFFYAEDADDVIDGSLDQLLKDLGPCPL